jgi:biopolymer transport protein ExbD
MPNPNAPPPTFEPEVININVEFDGTVDWNDQVVARPDDPASYDVLETYLKDVGKQPVETQSEIHLSADRVVKYDHVARVLAMAQRNRVIKIGLVGNEAFLGQ